MTDRRAELDAKFKAQEAARQEERERRKEAAADAADPTENVDAFWKAFNADVEGVHSAVKAAVKEAAEMGDAQKRAVMPSKAESWVASVRELQQRVSRATLFLPSYDIRQTQEALYRLNDAVEDAKAQVVPRKKFSFKRKAAAAPAAAGAGAGTGAAAGGAGAGADGKEEAKAEEEEDTCAAFQQPMKSFESQEGQLLVIRPGELVAVDAAGSDMRLSHLTNCTVIICDIVRALHVDNLKNCHVYVGPCAGSFLMEACSDCNFFFATRQARIHHAVRCKFLLHILSRPIIEDCSELLFGPNYVTYNGFQKQLQEAGLDKDIAKTMWSQVDDFRWHRAAHSPNWSELAMSDYPKQIQGATGEVLRELGLMIRVPATEKEAAAAAAAEATPAETTTTTAAAGNAGAADDDDSEDEL